MVSNRTSYIVLNVCAVATAGLVFVVSLGKISGALQPPSFATPRERMRPTFPSRPHDAPAAVPPEGNAASAKS